MPAGVFKDQPGKREMPWFNTLKTRIPVEGGMRIDGLNIVNSKKNGMPITQREHVY